jgi:hypothetical protein
VSEVIRLCGHVNDNRLRAVVADGDFLLIANVARRRGGACGCRSAGGACGASARRPCGARASGSVRGTRRSRCSSATVLDTHYVRLAFGVLRIEGYIDPVCAGGEVKEDTGICVRIDGFGSTWHVLRCFILDAYLCGTTWWGRIEASAIIIYAEGVCGSRKGIGSAVAVGGHGLKHSLRILAGTTHARCARRPRGARASGCLPPCRKREHQEKGEGC